MELILSTNCSSLTGSLGQGFGYYIRRSRTNRFFGQRSKGHVPRDGHLRFIFACAELAKMGLHVTGIRVGWQELQEACYEAGRYTASEHVRRNYADKAKATYDAQDIMNFKTTFGL